jgi:hypothetical protein
MGRGAAQSWATPAWPWAMRALCEQAVGVVPLGHGQGFDTLAFISFSYFMSLIKSMKIQKFMQVWFELRKM